MASPFRDPWVTEQTRRKRSSPGAPGPHGHRPSSGLAPPMTGAAGLRSRVGIAGEASSRNAAHRCPPRQRNETQRSNLSKQGRARTCKRQRHQAGWASGVLAVCLVPRHPPVAASASLGVTFSAPGGKARRTGGGRRERTSGRVIPHRSADDRSSCGCQQNRSRRGAPWAIVPGVPRARAGDRGHCPPTTQDACPRASAQGAARMGADKGPGAKDRIPAPTAGRAPVSRQGQGPPSR